MDAQRGIARRMVVGLPPDGPSPAWTRDFSGYPPAGVILFARDFADLEALRALTGRLRELARPRRIFIGIDEEGGFVSQLGGHLVVPPNAALLARGAAPGDIAWAARVTGERLRALGIDWVFAPVADVHSEPANPVIGPRAFGVTAAAVTAAVGEALAGYRAAGIGSCLKHFPGHGDTTLDSHLELPRCAHALDVLEAREFVPFRAHPEADAVMTAHVVYDALDPDRPGTLSPRVAGDLLRGSLGFAGLAITDALEMKGVAGLHGPVEAGRLALAAGCDLLLWAFHDDHLRRTRLALADLLVEGAFDRAHFDAARPRLEAFARRIAEPSADELARPLETLTPTDWSARLEGIVERGLRVTGTIPPGPWRVEAPAFTGGPALAEDLRAAGGMVDDGAAVDLLALHTRLALDAAGIEALRARCRARPTILAGFQNDAFLDRVPEAAARISVADGTPLARRVFARELVRRAAS